MSNQMNNAILAQLSPTEYQPTDPGAPNYIGAVDYPKTVYQGYIGSTNYVYEPRSTGYGIIDPSNATFPVAKMPKSVEYKELNLRTFIAPLLGKCSVPSFFQQSEDIVRRCTTEFGLFIFKIALALNFIGLMILYKDISIKFVILFVMFHIILYYILTVVYVNISIEEWKMFQRYRYYIKKNDRYSLFDSMVKQFSDISDYTKNQPINRTNILQIVLLISILFVWIPFWMMKQRR
jgi:hypothetical protein